MTKTYLDSEEHNLCCGCGACMAICPQKAIHMRQGYDKAFYPVIDDNLCVNCNACRRVCPFINRFASDDFERKAYAAVIENKDLHLQSASGGAFEGIADALTRISKDCFVVGAEWTKNLRVCHSVKAAGERNAFKKSKYLQSDCSGIYNEVKQRLISNNTVLFTGTPCQVAALKSFLGKDYPNLYTIDLVCHGIAGEGVFAKYIRDIECRVGQKVVSVEFRKKKKDIYGEIHSRNIMLSFEDGRTQIISSDVDSYLRGYHKGLFYRESCYSCPFANSKRNSDITIGDYWHIQKLYSDMVDYTGVSCVLVNTKKGKELIDKTDGLNLRQTSVDFLLKHNNQLREPCKIPGNRSYFFKYIDIIQFDVLIGQLMGKPKYIKRMVSALLPGKVKRFLRVEKGNGTSIT